MFGLCSESPVKIAIEIDGAGHCSEKNLDYDQQRDQQLNQLGIKILRILNIDVFKNLSGVIEKIFAEIEEHLKR